MSQYLLSPEAISDLDEIWDHYAVDLLNPDAADHVRDDLFDAFRRLGRTPGMGHYRTDLSESEKILIHASLVILLLDGGQRHRRCARIRAT